MTATERIVNCLLERKERGERGGGACRPRERGEESEAAQPPKKRGEEEEKRKGSGGAAARKRREKRGEGKKRRRRSRRRKREKKRERRAAAPPVSKRSRKQRFLFFCWGLFSWGAFSFFFSPAPSLPLCIAILSRKFPSSLLSGGRAFMSAKILFRRPFGDLSAILRRNPYNNLIPSLLRFYPPNQPQPPINQPYTPIPPINPTPPILPIPPIKPIHPISPICLVCCNIIAAKKPPCPGHQPRASSCGRPFMAVKNPLPSTPLLCGVHLPSLNFLYITFLHKKNSPRLQTALRLVVEFWNQSNFHFRNDNWY